MHPCQFLSNPYKSEKGKSDSDEDSEDEDEPVGKKLKISPLATLACSLAPTVNRFIGEYTTGLPEMANEKI